MSEGTSWTQISHALYLPHDWLKSWGFSDSWSDKPSYVRTDAEQLV